jgi:transposase-like protein
VQTAEGELQVEIPQVREAAQTFASKLFPRTPKLLQTEPLKGLVVGAFVRGLSMRDIESLVEKAGLRKLSRSTASRICQELRDGFAQFKRRSLYLNLAAWLGERLPWPRWRHSAAAREGFPCVPSRLARALR